MPDQEPTPPPPPPSAGPELGPKSTSTGLPSNVAAAIACIPLIGGVVFYIVEKHDGFVRFYAMQSIIFGGAWLLFNIASSVVHAVFGAIPGSDGSPNRLWVIEVNRRYHFSKELHNDFRHDQFVIELRRDEFHVGIETGSH